MSDPRRLLARLNATSSNYGIGSGGIPERTAQDIAGALGMVRDGLGRDVLTVLWWPDGAAVDAVAIDSRIRQAQLAEWMRRARAVEVARLAVELAQEEVAGTHGGIHGVKRALHRAKGELSEALAHRWPKYGPRYRLVRSAVLAELGAPHRCAICAGRGHARAGELVQSCAECNGTGIRQKSDRLRGERIGVGRTAFVKDWECVYNWTLALCAKAEQNAADELSGRLKL